MRLWDLVTRLNSGGGSGIPELNASPDPITPTLGSELITNGGFDSTVDNWTVSSPGTIASVSGGQSGNAMLISNNGGIYQNAYQQQPALTVGEYYQLSLYQYSSLGANGAGSLIRWGTSANGTQYMNNVVNNSGGWGQKIYIARVTSATSYVTPNINSTGTTSTTGIDTVSFKLITDTGVLVGDIGRKNGTYTCTPTVAQYSIAGMDINYLDANNLVRAVIKRNGDASNTTNAILLKRISGTWTEVISGAVTYAAEAPLSVVVSGTTFGLYYNSAQVGSNQTIDNSGLGTEVYGFNTLAGNTVGTVTTNP